MIEYELAGKVTFPVYLDCVCQQGRYDEHEVARHGYAADAPFIETPRDAREHYRKRFGIESSYHQAIDLLGEMPGFVEELDLMRLPHFTVLRDWFETIPMET